MASPLAAMPLSARVMWRRSRERRIGVILWRRQARDARATAGAMDATLRRSTAAGLRRAELQRPGPLPVVTAAVVGVVLSIAQPGRDVAIQPWYVS